VTPTASGRATRVAGSGNAAGDDASAGGERWGCLVLDRASRFVVAQATGRIGEDLVRAAVARAAARTGQRPLAWCSDGWRGYAAVLTQQYRRPVRTGARGRPPLGVPQALQLTQTVKQRDARGRLLAIEIRAALGTRVAAPGTVHVERLNGALRDRLNALTRKTHAFAKTDASWDALLGVQVFEHNWLRPHPALCTPSVTTGRRYDRRTPAMALHLTDHVWTWQEFLTTPVHVSS
jgi:IS1 family transposase